MVRLAVVCLFEAQACTQTGTPLTRVVLPSGFTQLMKMENPCSPETPEPDALVMLVATLREGRQEAIQAEAALEQAAPFLIETLTFHWGTGQGTRVRHILWSLYTCSHFVNLGESCSGLDRRLAKALSAAIAARLFLGPEVEPLLRKILQTSGEFARFDKQESATPNHLPVTYPPAPADARTFRKMADSLDHLAEGRI